MQTDINPETGKPKVILDLCGGTGAWSRPYQDAGYTVVLITLPQYDVSDVRFEPERILFKSQLHGDEMPIAINDIYGVLAAPPCTEFSLAKNGSRTPRDLESGLKTVEACERIIRHCQLRGGLKFWAMENPLGLLRKFLGRPKFTFKQWEFGDKGVKPTDVWGYFNEPRKTVKEAPVGVTKRYKSGKVNTHAWAAPNAPEWYKGSPLDRAARRAITPPGFAGAFFRANR